MQSIRVLLSPAEQQVAPLSLLISGNLRSPASYSHSKFMQLHMNTLFGLFRPEITPQYKTIQICQII